MDTILNFKTDKALKDEAKQVARDLGLPLGTIMNHYLRQFVAEQRVLFTNHPVPNKQTVAELRSLSEDVRNKKNLSPAFSNTKDAMAWLQS